MKTLQKIESKSNSKRLSQETDRMLENQVLNLLYQYKMKGRRCQGCSTKRWREQFFF
jgi:hypothetical protein